MLFLANNWGFIYYHSIFGIQAFCKTTITIGLSINQIVNQISVIMKGLVEQLKRMYSTDIFGT
jgi:hypothetical protein